MSLPTDATARKFYRAGGQRLDEANYLLKRADFRVGAVYLAGYCVECMLKALILSQAPSGKRNEARESFRGSKAHDFDWLRAQYLLLRGAPIPPDVVEAFSEVNFWGTDLRYEPGTIDDEQAFAFVRAAELIHRWADGRMS